jgi:hypothetical protein
MRWRIRLIEVRRARRRSQRPRQEQWNRRDQLEHMLSRHPSPARLSSFHIHHPMYPRFLRNDLIPRTFRDGLRVVRASAVPDASHVVSGDYLDEATGLYVADFDESAVEEEDVGWVPGDPLCCPFPLDCAYPTTWVSVFVDIQPELCESYQLVPLRCLPVKTHHRNRVRTRLCLT